MPENMFKDTLAKDKLLQVLFNTCQEYKEEITKILKLCLVKFQKGFDNQKGAIFGFDTHAEDETGDVLKMSELSDSSILKGAPVHNLGEERSVGMLTYKLA